MIHRFCIRTLVIAAVLGETSLAFAKLTGPLASRTGAPAEGPLAAERLCTACHFGVPNDPSGSLEILDLPHVYTPGQSYPVRVRLSYALTY